MPISEDEVENGYGSHQSYIHTGNMSKAEQRRSNKPIMEKRRRARINHCLNELKSLILDAMNKDPARHSKLEKADILEMTVKHLQSIQRQQMTLAVSADPSVVHKFQTGFSECAGEVSRYIGRLEGVEHGVKQRLVSHLASCVNGLQQMTPIGIQTNTSGSSSNSEDVNNNTASARLQMMTGLQLIPSRLPTGELALLLPNSQHLPFFPPPLDNQVSTTTDSPNATVTSNPRHSAFTAVGREKLRSPLPSPTSTTASSFEEESCDRPFPSPHLPEVTSTSESASRMSDSNFPKLQYIEAQGPLRIPSKNFSDFPKETQFDQSQSNCFPKFISPTSKPQILPLTVITSDEMLKAHPQKPLETRPQQTSSIKDPLDFSIKKESFTSHYPLLPKRPFPEDLSDKLLMKATEYQPPAKILKPFPDSQIKLLTERRSLFEIQNQVPTVARENNLLTNESLTDRKTYLEFQNQPSTSSSEVSRDMWRPW